MSIFSSSPFYFTVQVGCVPSSPAPHPCVERVKNRANNAKETPCPAPFPPIIFIIRVIPLGAQIYQLDVAFLSRAPSRWPVTEAMTRPYLSPIMMALYVSLLRFLALILRLQSEL